MGRGIRGYGFSVALLGLVTVILLGCGQSPSARLKNPFETSMSYFSLNGYSSGYEPGNTYRLGLTINNPERETWQSSYGIYLIDSNGVVLNIAVNKPFSLLPRSSMSADFDMVLPKGLDMGKYGLYLVFPGQGASLSTICLGDGAKINDVPVEVGNTQSPTGTWPVPGDLPQY